VITRRRIGLYTSAQMVVDRPQYFEHLQEAVGLNLVILGFSGELPASVLRASPFDGPPPSDGRLVDLLATHLDGRPSSTKLDSARSGVGPHAGSGGDDHVLLAAVHRAHDLGLEVWLLGGAWTASDYDVVMYCPSDEGVNHWFETLYGHMAANYGADGVDITHARYPMTSYPRGLGLCACPRCVESARELGYDLPTIGQQVTEGLERLSSLRARRLNAIAKGAVGFVDLGNALGLSGCYQRWLSFRADLLSRNLGRFRSAVHTAADNDAFVFLADTYPASLALFVGHDLTRWSDFSDVASPLLSHVDIFVLQTLTEFAQRLMGRIPGLDQTAALQAVYAITGYAPIALPDTIEGYALGEPDCEWRNVPLRELLALDMAKTRAFLPDDIPSYPIIQGGGAPHDWPREVIEQIMADSERLGHQGAIFQGTSCIAPGA